MSMILTRSASFDVALFCLFAPKGQSQISPGQRPGNTSITRAPALKGRNRRRFFTGNCDIARAENCAALSGLAVPWNPCSQGVALGWNVAALSGRNPRSATSKSASEDSGGDSLAYASGWYGSRGHPSGNCSGERVDYQVSVMPFPSRSGS